MTEQELHQLLSIEKEIYRKLLEAMDLTRDLAESVDRKDQVSIGLFLSLRQKVILELQELTASIDLLRLELSPSSEQAMQAILSGLEASSPQEIPVVECISNNKRFFQKLAELDKEVNRKLCGKNSCYLP